MPPASGGSRPGRDGRVQTGSMRAEESHGGALTVSYTMGPAGCFRRVAARVSLRPREQGGCAPLAIFRRLHDAASLTVSENLAGPVPDYLDFGSGRYLLSCPPWNFKSTIVRAAVRRRASARGGPPGIGRLGPTRTNRAPAGEGRLLWESAAARAPVLSPSHVRTAAG
jgi:hypothetical protein